jgi:hypothetical protein
MYPAHAAAPTAADGFPYLLPVVVEGTQEDPTLVAVCTDIEPSPLPMQYGSFSGTLTPYVPQ